MLRSFTGGHRRVFTLVGSVSVMVVLALAVIGPPIAVGQATRTWVSGVGDDANPCSRTAPCKTFAGAISKTAPAGEISVLDPGGFGAVTITKSISIVADQSGEGGILAAGTNGIIINAGVNDIVNIRGLIIEGAVTGLNGIKFLSGAALHVSNTTIRGFRAASPNGNGIWIANSAGTVEVDVTDSTVSDNGRAGILVNPTAAGAAKVVVGNTRMLNNAIGLKADGTSTSGISKVAITNSVAAENSFAGVQAFTPSGGPAVDVTIDHTVSSGNLNGVVASGSGAVLRIGHCSVTGNDVGISQTNSGVVESFQTNEIRGNTTNGGTPTPVSQT